MRAPISASGHFLIALLLSSLASSALCQEQGDGVELAPVREQQAYFGEEQLELGYRVLPQTPQEGVLRWRYAAGDRTLRRGETRLAAQEENEASAVVSLPLPPVREGVIFPTQLTAELYNAQDELLARHEQAIWLFPRDPFLQRKEWLEDLNIRLYDPQGATERAFEELEIPYQPTRNLSALANMTEGVLIVGEGVSFQTYRGLAKALVDAAAAGARVLCLAPADGALPFPAADRTQSVELRHTEVIHRFDKRFDASYWPPDGQVVRSRLSPRGARANTQLYVTDSPPGWPWLHAAYNSGGELAVCGFGVIEHWEASPTPRFLLARILEQLVKEEPTVPLEEK